MVRIASADGYSLDPEDAAAVRNLKQKIPATVGDVSKLLRFLGYYRRYIQYFVRIASPLYDIMAASDNAKQQLSNNHKINWSHDHQKRLDWLIDRVTRPQVMASPDFTKPFPLHTDASNEGLGAVLYQEQDGKRRVLGYASRTLTPAEKHYHIHVGKLDFLAL